MSASPPLFAESNQSELLGDAGHSRRQLALLLAALLLGPLVFAALQLFPELDLNYQSNVGHFWIVSLASLMAVGLALVMLLAAVARRDGRVLLIGAGFLTLSLIFLVHAISTPGVLFMDTVHATAWSTPLALLGGAIPLALSTSKAIAGHPLVIGRWRLWLLGLLLLWLLYAGLMLFYVPAQLHAAAPQIPATETQVEHDGYGGYSGDRSASDAPAPMPAPSAAATPPETLQSRLLALLPQFSPFLAATSALLFLFTALSYGRRWWRRPTRPLLTTTCAALLLAETAIAAQNNQLWHLSFWLYHVLLMAAILAATYGVVLGYEQSGSLSSSVEGLLLGSTLQRQRDAFQRAMTALLEALEAGSATPTLRRELRQRFSLADDQLDLLEHSVKVVSAEREEQHRLRALAEVGRALMLELDPDLVLRNAVTAFAKNSNVALCAVALIEGDQLLITPHHRVVHGQLREDTVSVPRAALPAGWNKGDAQPLVGELAGALAPLAVEPGPALLVPMLSQQRLLGVLAIQPGNAQPIDDPTLAVCVSVAAQLATALSNARLYQALHSEHEQLLRSEQSKEHLMQMVVHDLKNPLTAIMGYLDLLRISGLQGDQPEWVALARRSSNGMLQLVTDLLDIARLEEGHMELHRETTNLGELLDSCADELRFWAEQGHKTIQVGDSSAVPLLNIDGNLLRRVISNLLSNAIKHTHEGCTIRLSLAQEGQEIALRVADDGPGISSERLEQLFERFTTGSSAGQGQRNTGLGLTFCKLAVEAHGGSIGVESVLGQGTTFAIFLPSEAIAEAVGS